jgi:hypothetical protein
MSIRRAAQERGHQIKLTTANRIEFKRLSKSGHIGRSDSGARTFGGRGEASESAQKFGKILAGQIASEKSLSNQRGQKRFAKEFQKFVWPF